MGRTVFSKLMIIFIVIILISTVLSAFFISQYFSSFYKQQSENEMVSIANDVSTLAAYKYFNGIDDKTFFDLVFKSAENNEDLIWVIDSNSSIWTTANPRSDVQISDEEIIQYCARAWGDINQGLIVTFESRNQNVFNAPVLTVASPVIVDGTVVGAVFVHKMLSDLNASMLGMYRQIIFSGLAAAAVAVLLIFFMAKSILKPLKQVTNATKQLAKGNFDVRIHINSRDEIGELSETFNSVAEDLGKYENTRRGFVANVSHELRSPLTSMQGLVQGILDGTIAKDQQDNYLNVVLDETKRLNYLINDLLDLSQIESGKIAFVIQKIDINELIRRCLITFESKISAKDIEVDVELPENKQYVFADENRIKQVIMNLIDNAVKFTPESGTIRIYTHESPVSIFVHVNNTGGVIAEEDIPYVFERFYKADKSHTRTQEGTGLGLSIVKKILTNHGQNIWVRSSEEKGTTFVFTLKKV